MKKKSLLLLSILFFSFAFSLLNIQNGLGYELNTNVNMNLTSEFNNDDLIGDLAASTTYSNYELPKINSNYVIHDLTEVEISRLQRYTTTDYSVLSGSTSSDATLYQNINEYTVSAGFDSTVLMNLNYNHQTSTYMPNSLSVTADNYIIDDANWGYEYDSDCLTIDDPYDWDLNYVEYPDSFYVREEINSDDISEMENYDSEIWEAQSGCTSQVGLYFNDYDYDHVACRIRIESSFTTTYFVFALYEGGTSGEQIASNLALNVWNEIDFDWDENQDLMYFWIQTNTMSSSYDCNILIDYFYLYDYTHYAKINAEFNLDQYYFSDDTIFTYYSDTLINNPSLKSININGYYPLYQEETTHEVDIDYASTISIEFFFASDSDFDIVIDLFYIEFYHKLVESIDLTLDFEVNSLPYTETNVMTLISQELNAGIVECVYMLSTSALTYDPTYDLVITNQMLEYDVDFIEKPISVSYSFFTQTSANVWVVPSEVNLQINGLEISDTSYNEGWVSLIDYPNDLVFTSDDPSILFEFSISNYFEYNFNMNIISYSYLSKTLLLDFEDDLEVNRCEFGLSNEILKTYFNNIEQLKDHVIYPNYNWISDSSLKIEMLTQDDIYEELTFDSMNQISHDLTTDDLVEYEFQFHAPRFFSRWFAEVNYNITDFSGNFGSIDLDIDNDATLYLFTQELSLNDIVTLDFTINPGYTTNYEILSESQDEIQIAVYYSSEIQVTNVDLRIQLPFYFQSWDIGSQNINNNILTIENLNFGVSTQCIILNGEFQEPTNVEFSNIYNTESFSVYEGFNENIDYVADLDEISNTTKYGKIYPDANWNSMELYNSSDYKYTLTDDNEFYSQNGFTGGYLLFKCNPVLSFETINSNDKITLNIEMSLNASNIIVLFSIDVEDHYELNKQRNSLEINELSENVYYFYYDLLDGTNSIDIYIKVYQGNNILIYIFFGVGLAALIGIVNFAKKRREKKRQRLDNLPV